MYEYGNPIKALKEADFYRKKFEDGHSRLAHPISFSPSPNTVVSEVSLLTAALQNLTTTGNSGKISLKDHKIEIFKNTSEYTTKAFFQQFERARKSISYTDAQKVTALLIYMADKPRRWFEAEWELNQARP